MTRVLVRVEMGDALHAERHVLESEVRMHARAVRRVGEGGRFLNERPPFGVQVEQLSHYAVYRFVRGCRVGDDAGGICSDLLGCRSATARLDSGPGA